MTLSLTLLVVVSLLIYGLAVTTGTDFLAERNGLDEILDPAERAAALDNARRTLLQSLAGFAIIVTGLFGYWRLRISEGTQLTDRFTSAIEHLGSEETAVRMGALAALERLARDSVSDRRTVAEILSAFVRESSPVDQKTGPTEYLGPDIQMAVTILGRANRAHRLSIRRVSEREWPIDLRGVRLDGADFRKSDLSGANLEGSSLRGCRATGAIFSEANFVGADLSNSVLDGAQINRAVLERSDISNTSMVGVSLERSSLGEALIVNTKLNGANLKRATFSASTTIESSDFTGASLKNAKLSGVTARHGIFTSANMKGAELDDVVFADCDVRNANLRRARINDADFSSSDMGGVDMYATSTKRRESLEPPSTSGQIASAIDVKTLKGKNAIQRYEFTKRAIDILGASTLLMLISPVMLIAALAIRLEDRGPIIFNQNRVGRFGRLISIYKFRTMVAGGDVRTQEILNANERAGPLFKISSDPRVTRVGLFLRSSALDELPSLISVLQGGLSLVGPRPMLPDEVDLRSNAHDILSVKPGIVGLWQLNPAADPGAMEAGRRRVPTQALTRTDLTILLRTTTIVFKYRRRKDQSGPAAVSR